MMVFSDLKAELDSADQKTLWQCLSLKCVPQEYTNLVGAPSSNTTNNVRANGELSSDFLTSSGVRQGCPLLPLETKFTQFKFLVIDLPSLGSIIYLEYTEIVT